MAYKEYNYDTLAHFPSELSCTLEESHSAKRDKSNSYLGSVVTRPLNAIVNVEVLSTTDDDAYTFYHWFSDTLNGGTEPFAMYTEIFGRGEFYVLEITTDISEKIIGGNNRKIKFTAEILGVSYPDNFISDNGQVLANGFIYATFTVNDLGNDTSFVPENFTIFLNGKSFGVLSAEKINNALYVTPAYPITDYPTNVVLKHLVAEQGLGVFETLIPTNNSLVQRATPLAASSVSTDGETISIVLNKEVSDQLWSPGVEFVITADGEETGSIFEASVTSDTITVTLHSSRPAYQYETIVVSYIKATDVEILNFSDVTITNNSTVVSPEENVILDASVSITGATTIASMSIPQDRIYDPLLFNLELNGVSYDVVSATQSSGTLTVVNDFLVTDYVTSVNLEHTIPEWGFDIVFFPVTNNSTTPRISVIDAYTSQDGVSIYLVLDRAMGRHPSDSWLNGILSNMWLTADGITVYISPYVITSGDTTTVRMSLSAGESISIGQTLLLTYTQTTDIELAPFTNESVTNYSQITEEMRMVSAIVSSDGLTVTCIMSESTTVVYLEYLFRIDHGYLDIIPISAEQSGTTLTLDLPPATPIRDNVTVLINNTAENQGYGEQYNLAATNNSLVNAPEFSSAEVVSVGTYLILTMDEIMKDHVFIPTEFIVKVNGINRSITSVGAVALTNTIWIYTQGTIFDIDTVTLSFTPIDDPQVYPFTDESVTNNSTQTTSAPESPIYSMTEELIEFGGYYLLENSSASGSVYRGKLCQANGDSWTLAETIARYNRTLGTIDLSDGYYIDTQWIAPRTSAWAINGIYNVNLGTSYSIYTLDYSGSDTADVYLYDSSEPSLPTTPTYADIDYIPPTETFKLYDGPPEIVNSFEIVYTMATFNTV